MRLTKITAFSWAGFVLASVLTAQTPQGPDITANTQTGFPSFSQVATAANGDFVVTWAHKNASGPRRVVARRFAANGKARGRELAVSPSSSDGGQTAPRVAVAAGGGFLVVWEMGNQVDRSVVLGRAYSATGRALGPAFRLNPDSQALEVNPAVAAAPDGSFVATWTSGVNPSGFQNDDILARRFSAEGTPLGAAFKAVSPAGPYQNFSQVAVSGNGDFLIGWQFAKVTNGAYYFGVAARRFDAEGHPLGDGFEVAPGGLNDVNGFALAIAEDGEALFAWKGVIPDAPSTEFLPHGILSRRIAADGSPVGTAFLIREINGDPPSQEPPAVAVLPGGGYFVTWSNGPGLPSTIFGQSVPANGSLQGDLLQVNADSSKAGSRPAVAIAPNGRGIVTWTASLRSSTAILVRRLTSN